jgi:hypothetical protein
MKWNKAINEISDMNKKERTERSPVEQGVSPRRCLMYILNNWELYAEWCQEGRNPIDFLMTMPGRITEKDIEWAQKSLEQKAG